MREQPGPGYRFQRVSRSNSGGAGDRHAARRVRNKRPESDGGPEAHAKEQERGERDPRGRPRRGDDAVRRCGEEAKLGRREVQRGEQRDDGSVRHSSVTCRVSLLGESANLVSVSLGTHGCPASPQYRPPGTNCGKTSNSMLRLRPNKRLKLSADALFHDC